MPPVSALDPVDAALRERRPSGTAPVTAAGKLFMRNGEPFYLRGVTYGTFAPDENSDQFPAQKRVLADFRAMAANGFNVVRSYTVPPARVLDAAAECKMQILAGLTWEQHVSFLDEETRAADIRRRVRDQVRACAEHESIFGFTIGNEIPASIVRWHGRRKIERFLYESVRHHQDRFAVRARDLCEFSDDRLSRSAVPRFRGVQRLSQKSRRSSRPISDACRISPAICRSCSPRSGWTAAATGRSRKRTVSIGRSAPPIARAAPARSSMPGPTNGTAAASRSRIGISVSPRVRASRSRRLHTVRSVMAEMPFKNSRQWPKFSVIVCTYNGSRTIRDTLDNLAKLDYPNYEVIVVNDGSTDAVPEIVTGVRRPGHQHAEPGSRPGAQRRSGGRARRVHRLYR